MSKYELKFLYTKEVADHRKLNPIKPKNSNDFLNWFKLVEQAKFMNFVRLYL